MSEPIPQLLMRRPWLDDLPVLVALPEGWEVREATESDVPALATLLSGAYVEVWSEDDVRTRLTAAPDVPSVYVVSSPQGVLSTASARVTEQFPGSGYLHFVGTVPEAQGRGLGASMVLRVLQRFAELGLQDAVLETDDERLPAIRTYLRFGFVPELRSPGDPRRWAAIFPQLLGGHT